MKNLFQNPFKNKWNIIDGMMVLVLSTSMAVISYWGDPYHCSFLLLIMIYGCYISLFVANRFIRIGCMVLLLLLTFYWYFRGFLRSA